MKPHPKPELGLTMGALAALLLAFTLYDAARTMSELRRNQRADHNRRLELEEEIERRGQQLDGALEKITELKGGQPAGPDTAG